jgi:hypothetical protein
MPPLPDGTYDVIVIDVNSPQDGEILVDVTITLGPHVGQVATLRTAHVQPAGPGRVPASRFDASDDPIGLLGVPGTLRVRDGAPSFRPDTR